MTVETTNTNTDAGGGGGGCLTLLAFLLIFLGLVAMLGGGNDTSSNTQTNTRSGVLSGNQVEVLSRNQLNLFSEVWNCFGDGSCIITSEMVTNTTTSNTEVRGNGNHVNGQRECYDAAARRYSPEACAAQGVQP